MRNYQNSSNQKIDFLTNDLLYQLLFQTLTNILRNSIAGVNNFNYSENQQINIYSANNLNNLITMSEKYGDKRTRDREDVYAPTRGIPDNGQNNIYMFILYFYKETLNVIIS